MYSTNHARTPTSVPAHLRWKEAGDIVAYMQTHFRTDIDDSGLPARAMNASTAMMMAVSDTFFDPTRWKNPFVARYPQDALGRRIDEWVKAAIIWYHGAKPIDSGGVIISFGYEC